MPYSDAQKRALFAQGKGHLVRKYHNDGALIAKDPNIEAREIIIKYMEEGGWLSNVWGKVTDVFGADNENETIRRNRFRDLYLQLGGPDKFGKFPSWYEANKDNPEYADITGKPSFNSQDVLGLLPVVGDAVAIKEIYDELKKSPVNWTMIGILGGATVIGLIPGVGDVAAAAIKKGAKSALKAGGDVVGVIRAIKAGDIDFLKSWSDQGKSVGAAFRDTLDDGLTDADIKRYQQLLADPNSNLTDAQRENLQALMPAKQYTEIGEAGKSIIKGRLDDLTSVLKRAYDGDNPFGFTSDELAQLSKLEEQWGRDYKAAGRYVAKGPDGDIPAPKHDQHFPKFWYEKQGLEIPRDYKPSSAKSSLLTSDEKHSLAAGEKERVTSSTPGGGDFGQNVEAIEETYRNVDEEDLIKQIDEPDKVTEASAIKELEEAKYEKHPFHIPKTGDAELDKLRPLIAKFANSVPPDLRQDAIQEGIAALLEARKSFRKGANNTFLTYAYTRIKYAVQNTTGVQNAVKRRATIDAINNTRGSDLLENLSIEDVGDVGRELGKDILTEGSDAYETIFTKEVLDLMPEEYKELFEALKKQQDSKAGKYTTTSRYDIEASKELLNDPHKKFTDEQRASLISRIEGADLDKKQKVGKAITDAQLMDEYGWSRRHFEDIKKGFGKWIKDVMDIKIHSYNVKVLSEADRKLLKLKKGKRRNPFYNPKEKPGEGISRGADESLIATPEDYTRRDELSEMFVNRNFGPYFGKGNKLASNDYYRNSGGLIAR